MEEEGEGKHFQIAPPGQSLLFEEEPGRIVCKPKYSTTQISSDEVVYIVFAGLPHFSLSPRRSLYSLAALPALGSYTFAAVKSRQNKLMSLLWGCMRILTSGDA